MLLTCCFSCCMQLLTAGFVVFIGIYRAIVVSINIVVVGVLVVVVSGGTCCL